MRAGLATGEAADRSGVGIGVLTLRVSVAAAPGTGVGSALNSDEQPASAVTATSASAITARRAVLIIANRRRQTDRVARRAPGLHHPLGCALELITHRRLKPPDLE